jgi:two-component system, response regulator PdtaR
MDSHLRIAIADDDRSSRVILRQILQKLGHSIVVEADSGWSLVDQCAVANPDVVITDNWMADIRGLDAATEICRNKKIPIILISAFCDPDLVRIAEQRQIAMYMVKPIHEGHLATALSRCVTQRAAMGLSDELGAVALQSTEESECNSRLTPRVRSSAASAGR